MSPWLYTSFLPLSRSLRTARWIWINSIFQRWSRPSLSSMASFDTSPWFFCPGGDRVPPQSLFQPGKNLLPKARGDGFCRFILQPFGSVRHSLSFSKCLIPSGGVMRGGIRSSGMLYHLQFPILIPSAVSPAKPSLERMWWNKKTAIPLEINQGPWQCSSGFVTLQQMALEKGARFLAVFSETAYVDQSGWNDRACFSSVDYNDGNCPGISFLKPWCKCSGRKTDKQEG